MIEMNLARQLQIPHQKNEGSGNSLGLVGVVLCLGVLGGSWWWTQSQHQHLERLLEEKHVQTQLLVESQVTLSRLDEYQKERQLLSDSVEVKRTQRLGKVQPLTLLDGISRSADVLEIWLDRVQMVDQIVELHGQSLALKDIGAFIDALEHHQLVAILPVIEILDQKDEKKGQLYSFMIRFAFELKVAT